MSIKVRFNRKKLLAYVSQKSDTGLALMSEDIARTAKRYAPYETGALRTSGRNRRISENRYQISFNTPYALRRHYENKKNPRSKRYLERAGDVILKGDLQRYFL